MSYATTVAIAFALCGLSILPLTGMLVTVERHPVISWFCEGLFVVMAGTGIVWLLLCFYLAVLL